MDFKECCSKLKNLLVDENYNVLGYDYSEKQLKKLPPWFYPKKKKKGLPPELIEYVKMLEEKYPIAAQIKKKTMGQWYGPYFFFAVKADGMDYEQIKAKFVEFEQDLLKRYELATKKTAYEIKASSYIPMNMLAFIFEEGVPDDLYNQIREVNKDAEVGKYTRPYVFDLKNQRVDRDTGKMKVIGAPKPKMFANIFS